MKDLRVRFLEEAKDELRALELAVDSAYTPLIKRMKDALKDGVPFLLPSGGKILDDDLKGLPESFKLPFETTLLLLPSGEVPFKRIVIALQNAATEDRIIVMLLTHSPTYREWQIIPGMLRITPEGVTRTEDDTIVAKTSDIKYIGDRHSSQEMKAAISENLGAAFAAVCELAEALSCSNVNYRKNPRAATKDKRRPLMYDEYYTLMVDTGGAGNNSGTSNLCAASGSSGRHVREHLCRGHIRNQPYKDGVIKKIWINAVVKGAGNGGGKISKVYSMKGKV